MLYFCLKLQLTSCAISLKNQTYYPQKINRFKLVAPSIEKNVKILYIVTDNRIMYYLITHDALIVYLEY